MKNYLLLLTVALLAASIITGCESEKSARPSAGSQAGLVITVDRTACKGRCPVYSLTIDGNGMVIYQGKDYVRTTGLQQATIGQDKVLELAAEFDRVGYFSMNDAYTQVTITDSPTVTTSITRGGKTKTIVHYHGDLSAPEQLSALEDKIDQTANSAQWIK